MGCRVSLRQNRGPRCRNARCIRRDTQREESCGGAAYHLATAIPAGLEQASLATERTTDAGERSSASALAATVYALDRLRCNGAGEVFAAPEPEGIGASKYRRPKRRRHDRAADVRQRTECRFIVWKEWSSDGNSVAASTEGRSAGREAARMIKAARDESSRPAAQGDVLLTQ